MDNQVTLFPDGQLVEFKEGVIIRRVATQGSINDLIKALKFSRTNNFSISCTEAAPTDDILQSRGEQQRINDTGLKLLTNFEGCELTAYDDGVGVWTIGYGHTADVVRGMTITQAQAEEMLRQDLETFESYVTDLVTVDVNPDQFSALVCFCYNTGPGEDGFGGSTLLRLFNSGDFAGAAQQFLRWNKGGGEPMLGLTRRRLAEQALFVGQPWEFARTYEGPLNLFEQGVSVQSASISAQTGPRSLKLTHPPMQGEDVRRVQEALLKAGLSVGSNGADGIFGQVADAAVKQFQKSKGLTDDGIVGDQTLRALSL